MKKYISLFLIIAFTLTIFSSCSGVDISDKVVKENIDDLYLVVLGDEDKIEIDNLVISRNQFDDKFASRKFKAIFIATNYVDKISSQEINDLNNKIANENYWLIYYSKNYENVKNFALKFGKAIPAPEQNYLRGYSLHFNKTQRTIQGITHYTTEKNESKEECNNMIKNIFRDMIESRYEDTTTY